MIGQFQLPGNARVVNKQNGGRRVGVRLSVVLGFVRRDRGRKRRSSGREMKRMSTLTSERRNDLHLTSTGVALARRHSAPPQELPPPTKVYGVDGLTSSYSRKEIVCVAMCMH